MTDRRGHGVIPSWSKQIHRFAGSGTFRPGGPLWMNLCKLWIGLRLLRRTCQHCPNVTEGSSRVSDDEVGEVQVADVPAEFDESVVLLDVREDDEWQRGHAVGALHIPLGDVPARVAEIDPEATLYVVCHAGGRSLRAAQYLARTGYEPINVAGGMLAWAGAGRPVVTDAGTAGSV